LPAIPSVLSVTITPFVREFAGFCDFAAEFPAPTLRTFSGRPCFGIVARISLKLAKFAAFSADREDNDYAAHIARGSVFARE
jgi:hypothetical protein